MMRAALTPDAANTALAAVVREQLAAAYQRGWDDHAADSFGLVDRGAPGSFKAIMTAASDYGQAIARAWRDKRPGKPAGGTL